MLACAIEPNANYSAANPELENSHLANHAGRIHSRRKSLDVPFINANFCIDLLLAWTVSRSEYTLTRRFRIRCNYVRGEMMLKRGRIWWQGGRHIHSGEPNE